jgi:hypothetical protein
VQAASTLLLVVLRRSGALLVLLGVSGGLGPLLQG